MTAFLVQRIDEDRRNTPRVAYPGGFVAADDGWLVYIAADDHEEAALLAYKQWQAQRCGCTILTSGEALGEVASASRPWQIRVWNKGEADDIRTFFIRHEVVIKYRIEEQINVRPE